MDTNAQTISGDGLGAGAVPKDFAVSFINGMSDGFCLFDRNWRISFVNDTAATFFGSAATSLVDRVLWEVFPTLAGSLHETELCRAMRENRAIQFTAPSVVRPGRWIEMRAHPFIDGLAVYFLDVTDRELALMGVRANEAQLNILIDAAPAPISYIDQNYRYCRVNKAYEEWFGRKREEIIGLTAQELLGAEAWKAVGPNLVRAMTGETVTYETELPYEKAGRRWVRCTYTPDRDFGGLVRGVMVLVIDLTQPKATEEALRNSEAYHRSLFEVAGVGNAEVDPESGRYLRVNRKYCQLVGYSEQELLDGMTIFDVTHPDDLEESKDRRSGLLTGRQEAFQIEKQYLRKDKTVVWVHLTVTMLKDGSGKPSRLLGIAQDISERKSTEEELRRIAEELQETQEAAPVAIWVSQDPDCAVILGNSTALELCEAEPGENLSQRSTSFEHPSEEVSNTNRRKYFDGQGRELSVFELPMQQAVFQNRPLRDQLLTMQAPSGKRRVLFGSAVPLRDHKGDVRGCVGAFMDVTARLEAERALSVSEEQLRMAVAASGIGCWSWDIASGQCELDEVTAQMFGTETVVPASHVFERMVATDRERVQREVEASVTGFRPYRTEFGMQNVDGKIRWLVSLGDVVRDSSGRPVRMFGVNVDISERKRVEEERQKFVSLVENSSEFIGICDLKGMPIYANEAALRLSGLTDLAHLRRTPIREFFFPEDRDFVMGEFIPRVIQEGRGELEIRLRNFQTGEARWMIYNVFSLKGSDGQVMGLATVSRDITERKLTEVLLKDADRRKDEFLATLAHELRNPLAPISNALQIWPLVEKDPKKAAETRAMMERQVKQLRRLIDDLLDVSRISRGKISLRKEHLNVATIIERAIEAAQPFVESRHHTLHVEVPQENMLIDGDAGRLMQVFGNLIHNAAKYTDEGGIIVISAHRERDNAVVSVKDNGPGIPREMLASIFEAFTQVDGSLDRAQGGLGIGLTLVKTLVELHGGTVEAKCEGMGKGAEFLVTLPALRDESKEASKAESTGVVKKRGLTLAVRYRVLVVDDLKPSADTLAMMLEGLGHETRVAYDGSSALETARTFQPEVVLSDIAMPGMDGFHFAERIRGEINGNQPLLVALTGYGQEHDRRRAFRAGFDHHLVKPTTMDALEDLLSKVRVSVKVQ